MQRKEIFGSKERSLNQIFLNVPVEHTYYNNHKTIARFHNQNVHYSQDKIIEVVFWHLW